MNNSNTSSPKITYCDDLIEEWREKPLYHHIHNLSYTATGYGKKIPTRYMVRIGTVWYRVYTMIFSNIGSNYILRKEGKFFVSTSFPEMGIK